MPRYRAAGGISPYVQLRYDRSIVCTKAPHSSPRIYSVRMVGRGHQCVLTRLGVMNVPASAPWGTESELRGWANAPGCTLHAAQQGAQSSVHSDTQRTAHASLPNVFRVEVRELCDTADLRKTIGTREESGFRRT